MPFRVVNGVGKAMGVLDGDGECRRGRDSFRVNVGHPIVTIWNLRGLVILCREGLRRCFSQIALGFLVEFGLVSRCYRLLYTRI